MAAPETQTAAEHMVAAILHEIEDGDVLLEGIGTFLPTSAYILAQATHAPRAIRLCPVGNVFVAEPHRISLAEYEFETLRRGVGRFTYGDVNGAYLPSFIPGGRGRWKEFLRPAQVDRTGRTNNVVVGPYEAPKVRLPGAAGLPDGVPVEPALYMYVPRHDRNAFVGKLDFVSAPGLEEGAHPHYIVSNLAIMRFASDGALEVETIMPGASFEEVQDNTAFDLRLRSQLVPFRPLSPAELMVLRNDVDPQSLRDLEFHVGEHRLSRIESLARREGARENLTKALATIVDRRRAKPREGDSKPGPSAGSAR
jgi:acyl CoA:acetate/3-ketoacid CoA transferase beta subunit